MHLSAYKDPVRDVREKEMTTTNMSELVRMPLLFEAVADWGSFVIHLLPAIQQWCYVCS